MRVGPALKLLFFGNYFYGVCAIALAIEASLQQRYPLNGLLFYLALFGVTTWYYTKAYITERTTGSTNQRTNWYVVNKTLVRWSQRILRIMLLALLALFLTEYFDVLFAITPIQVLLILTFPTVALLYYGVNVKRSKKFNLRNVGWLKPFIIGFTWAGMVTVYPVLFYQITNRLETDVTLIGLFLFMKNFMFIAVLGIMFDIKDYATDYNHKLKTFVVKNGLRRTIFYVLIPLSVAGLGSFILYGSTHDFSTMKIILNTVPFLLMLTLAYSLHRRKSILYYLGLVDGLMLVKALCGSIAMTYF